jgi:hypothetical protein
MPEGTIQTMRAAVSQPVMMGHLEQMARWVKLSGTADELKSLAYVQSSLDAWGFETNLILHDAFISLPGKASVIADNQALTAITHSHSQPSPAAGTQGRLVYVGNGSAADLAGLDVRGAIVLVEGIANPVAAKAASAAGAVGQLHISPHHHIHEMCVSPVWGSPTTETIKDMPSTVICSIAQADGARLRDRLANGESPQITLHAEVDTSWRKTPILEAKLTAPNATPDTPFVLLSGHHDTWYYGVMDNGSANTTMLEVARLAAENRDTMIRNLRVCFWSGHSHGRYSGSVWYVDTNWDELDRLCVAHVNVDSTGGIGATVLEDAAAAAELQPLAKEAIELETGAPYHGKRKNRSSDDSFPGIGIPSMFGALSEQPPSDLKMRNALGWWWHTPEDTIDKVDIAFLARDTRVFAHVVGKLLTAETLPIDYTAHAAALGQELAKIAETLAGRFDISSLQTACAQLATAAAGPHSDTAIMAAGRALVPTDYTKGDRFTHDPATPLPPWPVLQPIRDLAATLPGTDAAHFAEVAAMRARNRMGFALREALKAFK